MIDAVPTGTTNRIELVGKMCFVAELDQEVSGFAST